MDKAVILPTHIAIIMDGNRRWAKKRNLPIGMGHKAGAETLQKVIESCIDIGIKYLTVYAFSTENWKRDPKEVSDLMNLLREYLAKLEKDNQDRNARICVIGDITKLDADLQEKINSIQEKTKNNTGITINVALNYGGRDEILNAIKRLNSDEIKDLTVESFNKKLYTADSPDPDLIIRTAGEQRLSNFLLWQCAYSEFWYTDVLWPDFSRKTLENAISDFGKRNRKFGGK